MAVNPADDPVLRLSHGQHDAQQFRAIIAAAVVHNAAYDEVLANEREAQASRNEARARIMPTVDVSVSSFKVISRAFSDDFSNLLERQRPDHRTDAILRGQQMLFDFGATQRRITAGNERLLAAAANTEDTATQLALRAIAAWYNVVNYRALIALSDGFVAGQRALRGMAEERIRQGVSAEGDMAQIDSYIASADGEVAEFRRGLSGAEAQFAAATGITPPAEILRAPPPLLTGVTAGSISSHINELATVRAARSIADATRSEARATSADTLPQVSLGVDAGRYGVFETSRDYDIRGNVTLSWRLGGGATQRRDQAYARALAADARLRRTQIEADRDAQIALTDVAALSASRDALETNYLASRRSRDVLVERFRVSRGTLLDVLAAEQNFFAAATRYLQTVAELDTARYVLLARTGQLLPELGIILPRGAVK